MRCLVKVHRSVLLVAALAWLTGGQATTAHADTPRYPCDYPGVGVGGGGFGGSGAYCDFPVEANGTHWHCQTGRFSAFDIIGPGSVAAPGVGVGAEEYSCGFQCPDQTPARPPNPPGTWKTSVKVNPTNNVCIGHDAPPQPYDQTQDNAPPRADVDAPQPASAVPLPDVTTPLPPNPDQTHPQK